MDEGLFGHWFMSFSPVIAAVVGVQGPEVLWTEFTYIVVASKLCQHLGLLASWTLCSWQPFWPARVHVHPFPEDRVPVLPHQQGTYRCSTCGRHGISIGDHCTCTDVHKHPPPIAMALATSAPLLIPPVMMRSTSSLSSDVIETVNCLLQGLREVGTPVCSITTSGACPVPPSIPSTEITSAPASAAICTSS